MVTTSAPGKVHLIGEHAVVYGKPAIIAAISLRTRVVAELKRGQKVEVRMGKEGVESSVNEVLSIASKIEREWKVENERGNFSRTFELFRKNYLKAVVGCCMKELGIEDGMELEITTDIPLGCGLGSSASVAVATAKAMAEVNGIKISKERNNEIAFKVEQWGHGRPSGGDNSACCYGGVVWFKRGEKNVIKSLSKEIPYVLNGFVLVHSGIPEKTTGELVQMVRNLDGRFRNERIERLGELAHEMRKSLKKRDFEKMASIINSSQDLLSELGLSTPNIDKIVNAVRKIGGAAKLSGAGGGGIVLCWHEDGERLKKTIISEGFKTFDVKLGVEGVRVDER